MALTTLHLLVAQYLIQILEYNAFNFGIGDMSAQIIKFLWHLKIHWDKTRFYGIPATLIQIRPGTEQVLLYNSLEDKILS